MAIQISPISLDNTILTPQEQNLVASKEMIRFFGLPEDFVQLYVYNNLGTLLANNPNFQNYSVTENKEINFDPAFDIEQLGFRLGTYELQYNFLRPLLTQNPNLDLFIKGISADRTEIKVTTTTNNNLFYSNAVAYIDLIQTRNYFIEYYLDLGNNNLLPALSMAAEKDIFGNTTVTIKLENPLPNIIGINTPLNVVEKIVNTQTFQAVLTTDVVSPTSTAPTLRQANFSLDVDSYRIGSSDYYNYNQILNLTQSSELQTLLSFISSSNPTINVDYTDYNNFIHFGSAVQQLETFQYKLNQIQTYENAIATLPSNDLNYILYQNQINSFIQNFTGYEEYLYYQSSSFTWPKSNNTIPYTNYPTTASQAITWYNFQQTSASYYDEFNNNNLVYALPVYLQESPTFNNAAPFIHSIGQMFDDIWIYIKAMTNLWKADNALQDGISKDLVGIALQSLGIKLYTDGDQDDLYTYLYGTSQDGSPYFQTSSFQTAITASEYTLSGQDEAKTIFKRIYHNLPTLLKSKGSNKFLNYLNTLYGIPETVLYSQEYGGVDKSNNTPEFIYNKFTYGLKYNNTRYSYIYKPNIGAENYGFKTLEFRFNPITGSGKQILIAGVTGSGGGNVKWGVIVEPTSSLGYNYGIVNLINFDTGSSTYISSSVLLPIYVTSSNNTYGWWDVSITEKSTNQYTLNVQNKIDGLVGHQTSSILTTVSPLDNDEYYISIGNINPSGGITIPSQFGTGTCYSQIQEVRGWSEILTTSSLNTHTLNPESYIGNSESSSYDNLLWRFPLGNDLNIYNHSTILSLTGSQPKENLNNYLIFSGSWSGSDYTSFVETYYSLPAVGGYSTPVTDKIRIVTQTTSSNILHPQKSIIYPNPSVVRTTDIHLTQTGLSPQDQINNDIIAQLGDTYNLDDIIGNPLLADSYSYSELENLRDQYFKKYKSKYNYKDFTQLVETFHKSLFRYITESIPGRSEEATGLVIKPHILERSKVKRYEPTIDTSSYEGTIYIGNITASNPGGYCCSRNSPFNEAFINGNFSGSEVNLFEYYNQQNPFVKYPVTVDTKSFSEQYGGWDALNNNVSSGLLSRYKQIEVKQPTYRNPNNICGTCGEWEIFIGDTGSSELSPGYSYTNCSTGNITTVNTSQNVFIRIESCNQPSAIIPASASISFIGYNRPQFLTSASYFTDFEWDDSLTTNTSYVTSRESGVKTVSNGFNLPILTGSVPTTESLSNAEKTTTFMAFSDWAGNSLAGKFGTSNFHIKWLIDEDGNVYKPQNSSSYYWNTDQAFGAGTPVNISLYSGDGNISGDYETAIHMPLRQYNTILYSSTGSLGTNYLQSGSYTSLNFQIDPNISYEDFSFNASFDFDTSTLITSSQLNFNSINQDLLDGWNNTTKTWTYNALSPFLSLFSFDTTNTPLGSPSLFNLNVFRNNEISPIFTQNQSDPTLKTASIYLNPGDELNFTYGGTGSDVTTTFEIIPILTTAAVTPNYWNPIGGSTTNVLRASSQLSLYYNSYKQVPKTGSGFPDPILFIIQPYDQIRFIGNENRVYTIMNVYLDTNNLINIVLDRSINTTNININDFSIRRLVNDAGFIMIDNNPQQQTGTAPSFIIPKYASKTLKNNLNNIIQNLYQKNLL